MGIPHCSIKQGFSLPTLDEIGVPNTLHESGVPPTHLHETGTPLDESDAFWIKQEYPHLLLDKMWVLTCMW